MQQRSPVGLESDTYMVSVLTPPKRILFNGAAFLLCNKSVLEMTSVSWSKIWNVLMHIDGSYVVFIIIRAKYESLLNTQICLQAKCSYLITSHLSNSNDNDCISTLPQPNTWLRKTLCPCAHLMWCAWWPADHRARKPPRRQENPQQPAEKQAPCVTGLRSMRAY